MRSLATSWNLPALLHELMLLKLADTHCMLLCRATWTRAMLREVLRRYLFKYIIIGDTGVHTLFDAISSRRFCPSKGLCLVTLHNMHR